MNKNMLHQQAEQDVKGFLAEVLIMIMMMSAQAMCQCKKV
jgi:hypothetical protein